MVVPPEVHIPVPLHDLVEKLKGGFHIIDSLGVFDGF